MSAASTSIEPQRDAIGHLVKARGDTLAAVTEDVDTSGPVSPFDPDDLGPWLSDPARIGQWDGIMVHKLDRLTRSLIYFIGLLDWCKARGKTVISVSESLDFASPHGRMFAQLLAMSLSASGPGSQSGGRIMRAMAGNWPAGTAGRSRLASVQ